jgi:hypothetical protein
VNNNSPEPAAETIQRKPGPSHFKRSLPEGGSGIDFADFSATAAMVMQP